MLATYGTAPAAEPAPPGRTDPAAHAVNALGLDLLSGSAGAGGNTLLSPYSIQVALAMTFAGAAGDTQAEMARVLHYPGDETALHQAFNALSQALEKGAGQGTSSGAPGRPRDPYQLTVANRLFGQTGFAFREPFLALVKDQYDAPLEMLDFVGHSAKARLQINGWVEERTRQRIRDLVPPDGVNRDTRLVLVNAIYFKAPWMNPFSASATQPRPFYGPGGAEWSVPTMTHQGRFGFAQRDGYRVVTLPYSGGDLQLLVVLPDAKDGWAGVQAKLTPALLAECAAARPTEVRLFLPKFKLEPPVLRLGEALRALGLRTAFDVPPGSANFDRLAPRRPDDYLAISEVFHRTFLELDEKGTEAAAATAVTMMRATSVLIDKPQPIEVRVDHPFLFAIQHRPSGACLFLGRLSDPR